MGQMAVCYQNLTPGEFSSHSALSALVGALFKMGSLVLNTLRILKTLIISFITT
jgi:hypothetical protein